MKKVNIVTVCVISSLLCSPAIAQAIQSGPKINTAGDQSNVVSRVERTGATLSEVNRKEGDSDLLLILGAISAGLGAAVVALSGGDDASPVSP